MSLEKVQFVREPNKVKTIYFKLYNGDRLMFETKRVTVQGHGLSVDLNIRLSLNVGKSLGHEVDF